METNTQGESYKTLEQFNKKMNALVVGLTSNDSLKIESTFSEELKNIEKLATSFKLLSTEFLLHYRAKKEKFNKPMSDYRREALDNELELLKDFYEESAEYLDLIGSWALDVDLYLLAQKGWKEDVEQMEKLFLSELSESTIREIYDQKEIKKRLEIIEQFGYEAKKQTFHR